MSMEDTGRTAGMRGWFGTLVKALLTVGAFYLLLAHHVTDEAGNRVTTFAVIQRFLPRIDLGLFVRFVILAALVKLVGILCSMWRWMVLLRGQGIELPFRHIFGSFLIGRFLGTFLPSTIGLDGYKLYDAARFSGRSVEVSGATLVEKVLGNAGIFVTYLVALPFGVSIFGERAARIAALTVPIALLPIALCGALFVWPGPKLVRWLIDASPLPRYRPLLGRLGAAATAYNARPAVLALALVLSFGVHFTTAALYFCTALAVGVTSAQASFWQVTFASSIQILATVLSPFTIAGEGIREIAQYYLLSHLMGPAEAIVSAALGFWAAEGLTLFGGLIWWARSPDYCPAYCLVDGRQVDYREAARAARELGIGTDDAAEQGGEKAAPLASRLLRGAGSGLFAGLCAGVLLGLADAAVTLSLAGSQEDTQVLWYAVALYGALLGLMGAGAGAVVALLPLPGKRLDVWSTVLAFVASFLPLGLAVALFRLQRDVYAEQRPPLTVALAALLAAMVLTLAASFAIARFARHGRTVKRSASAAVGVAGWLGVLALCFAAATALAPRTPSPRAPRTELPSGLAGRPNVVLVVVDTLRADHLGAYGDRRGLTPNIDAFARQATAYQTYGQSSWTKPSFATIFTSLYASSHGAMSKTAVLPESAVTLAEVLRDGGYTTAGFVSNINLAPSFNFDKGFVEYHYLAPDYLLGARESSSKLVLYSLVRKVWFTLDKSRVVNQYYQDSRTVNRAVFDWLEKNRGDRFFLLVHYMDPHDPYFEHPYDGVAIARVENPNPSPALGARMKELYAGDVKYMDESFGELVTTLRRLGLYDDTALIVAADHGEEFQEHGGWWHGTTLYDEQIHVPLIVKWPRGAAPPATAAPGAQARLLDLAPTIAAIAGLAPAKGWQGADLGGGIPDGRPVFAEEDHEGNVLTAVRTPTEKLIRANPGNPRGLAPEEMYDLASDPREKRNLATADPAGTARLASLMAELNEVAAGQAVASSGEVKLDQATKERLRALGYAQ
jgi:arylsulfatase A-like enzyme